MAAALGLLVAGPTLLYVGGFALLTALLQVFVGYERYAALLRWLSLSLLAYVAAVFVVGVPWLTVAHDLVCRTSSCPGITAPLLWPYLAPQSAPISSSGRRPKRLRMCVLPQC